MQQVVIKKDFPRWKNRRNREQHHDDKNRNRAIQPNSLEAGAGAFVRVIVVIQLVLCAAQEQRREKSHHRHQRQDHSRPGNNTHFLDAFKISESHREERSGRGEAAGEDAHAGVDHGSIQGDMLRFAFAQLFLIAGNQVDAEIDRQAN